MAKSFKNLTKTLSPESQARVKTRIEAVIKEISRGTSPSTRNKAEIDRSKNKHRDM